MMKNIFATLGTALLLPLSMTAQAASTECNNPSLIDTGNGTVIDRDTGLMWTQCTYGMERAVDDVTGEVSCVYELDEEGDAVQNTMGVATAMALASAATPTGYFATAGHTDWRVPNINELWSLVNDCDGIGPDGFVDPEIFPDQYIGNTQTSNYLPDHFGTSTPVAPDIIGTSETNATVRNLCLQMKGGYPLMGACERNGAALRIRLVRDVTTDDYAALPSK